MQPYDGGIKVTAGYLRALLGGILLGMLLLVSAAEAEERRLSGVERAITLTGGREARFQFEGFPAWHPKWYGGLNTHKILHRNFKKGLVPRFREWAYEDEVLCKTFERTINRLYIGPRAEKRGFLVGAEVFPWIALPGRYGDSGVAIERIDIYNDGQKHWVARDILTTENIRLIDDPRSAHVLLHTYDVPDKDRYLAEIEKQNEGQEIAQDNLAFGHLFRDPMFDKAILRYAAMSVNNYIIRSAEVIILNGKHFIVHYDRSWGAVYLAEPKKTGPELKCALLATASFRKNPPLSREAH